ncbi:diguanylate cyclase [Sphingomonas sp. Leaf67]|uniref:putative bifunctional diguanylate cyclase/phosphodiesterase n=1 Tax=Sphingomonas sp. Leaf67 TaxID=1736230 RepID=UPI0006FB82B4|nr:EAL domain-containing protein [Sphingomonas sp. Leaf67]KQN88869.1 diguanylate cyclase [Sphingomonas sp. Leaf67]
MMQVALCIAQEHDARLVALALLVCLIGSAATVQLFGRIRSATGQSRHGWIVLAAVATGTMVWATHFVAMMAFRTQAPVVLDPLKTLLSLLAAVGLAIPGLGLAASRKRWGGIAGGSIVGSAISIMHYLGMAAYRVDGIVTWAWGYVAASVLLSVAISGIAFHRLNVRRSWRRTHAVLLLALAVAALHFTGMAAMRIAVLKMGDGLSNPTMMGLAITTAIASLIIVGCAAISALIDSHSQNESYRRLRRMALHDGLTDLPNRMSFLDELQRRFLVKGGYTSMAVIMMDLSRFKVVNDTHGHQAGDQLLMALAARLSSLLKRGECVGRLGGDEFAAVVSYDSHEQLTDFLDRLRMAFVAPFTFDRFTASISSNIGVALAIHDGFDADALLAKADLAMYRAKSNHSAEPCFYDAQMDDAARTRRELVAELRKAIETQDFELHFQVQAAVATGEILGYEALVRWKHPGKGMISPATFIPLAEESGEIVPLSIWILRQACFEAALWPNRHCVSVNLSPKHLSDPRLIETVHDALADSGLAAERLTLELTESAIIHDRQFALAQLRALKAMGIAIALDDFGTGYSSLDVLRSFPFDCLKLDASFVAEIERDEQAVAILQSVTALGAKLNMRVLAEGIEQPAQLSIVAREGCSAIQGYLIGRPSRTLCTTDIIKQTMSLKPRALATTPSAA